MMRPLRIAIEVLQWICVAALVGVVIWLLVGCVSMVNLGKGDQTYSTPHRETLSGTNIDSHDIDLELRP